MPDAEEKLEGAPILVLGGDETTGAFANAYSRGGEVLYTNAYDNEVVDSIDEMSPMQLRHMVAPVMGLGAASHSILECIERDRYSLTATVAMKLLEQCDFRDSGTCVIFCGGTGVGKSEGARLQASLSLADKFLDISYEFRRIMLAVFTEASGTYCTLHEGDSPPIDLVEDEFGGAQSLQDYKEAFVRASLCLGSPGLWQVLEKSPFALSDAPVLYLGVASALASVHLGCLPLSLRDMDSVEVEASDGVVLSVKSNGVNALKICTACTVQGAFSISLCIEGVHVQGSPFHFEAAPQDHAPLVLEEPHAYTAGIKASMSETTKALIRATASPTDHTILDQRMLSGVAFFVIKVMKQWVRDHALVPANNDTICAKIWLDTMEEKLRDHALSASDVLKRVSEYGAGLRKPTLMFKTCIHPSTTVAHLERIVGGAVARLARVIAWLRLKHTSALNRIAVVFLDELNTSSFPGIIKQLMLDRRLGDMPLWEVGKKEADRLAPLIYRTEESPNVFISEDSFGGAFLEVNDQDYVTAAQNIFFVGAINPKVEAPSRSLNVSTHEQDETEFNVTELPDALKNLVVQFGDPDQAAIKDLAKSMIFLHP